MSTETFVSELPKCDLCVAAGVSSPLDAEYDGRTIRGSWANMCEAHFQLFGTGLGTGRGQKLVVRPVTVVETAPDVFEQPDTSKSAFTAWMKKVDAGIGAETGLSAFDLGDQDYRGWFEDGMTPADATMEVVSSEMEEMGFPW